uniref:Uncharacterized protein n=1 Tax=Glossina morsitans morsitans TaxID=37546 RepID=A0A1B0G1Z2_GLOMM
MKSWILVLLTVGAVTIIDGSNDKAAADNKVILLYHKRACLEMEGLSEEVFPGDDVHEIFATMFQLESEVVPYETKCFLRCWLKRIQVMGDHLTMLKKKMNPDGTCERAARAASRGDECEFAFLYQKCDHLLDVNEFDY